MSQTDIFEKVKGIIVDQLGAGEKDVLPTSSFVDDLGLIPWIQLS